MRTIVGLWLGFISASHACDVADTHKMIAVKQSPLQVAIETKWQVLEGKPELHEIFVINVATSKTIKRHSGKLTEKKILANLKSQGFKLEPWKEMSLNGDKFEDATSKVTVTEERVPADSGETAEKFLTIVTPEKTQKISVGTTSLSATEIARLERAYIDPTHRKVIILYNNCRDDFVVISY